MWIIISIWLLSGWGLAFGWFYQIGTVTKFDLVMGLIAGLLGPIMLLPFLEQLLKDEKPIWTRKKT